jgi:hypothetical protein
MRARARRRDLAPMALALLLACSDAEPEPDPPAPPPAGLRERVAQRLAIDRDSLRASIGHYGLVFDVTQEDLERFRARIVARRRGDDIVMGGVYGIELHGGGVLGLLAEHWRPEGRPATLADRAVFAGSGAPVSLQAIYDAHKRQLFVPPGEPPGAPALPRMRLGYEASGEPGSTDVDAFTFLSLLVHFEEDLEEPWRNELGQPLTGERVLGLAWDRYLDVGDAPAAEAAAIEFSDHSYLHLPEILLAYGRRAPARDPNAIKHRFLANELRRTEYGGYDATEALGHYADTLGVLLADPRVSWADGERALVATWLAKLDENWPQNLAEVPPQHLAHLLRGLEAIDQNEGRLR